MKPYQLLNRSKIREVVSSHHVCNSRILGLVACGLGK